jgi:NAD-dependent deacetylase
MDAIDPGRYRRIVFFTGAGMSAESGVPTYRGKGGVWSAYDWKTYACEHAFLDDPGRVLDFHEKRREAVLACQPHAGHLAIAAVRDSWIVTQNIDGMHQRAGSRNVVELHGSLWRLRCMGCGFHQEDFSSVYASRRCACGHWLRPDIVWFGDMLDGHVMKQAAGLIADADLFVSVGTSGTVWPAAGFPDLARKNGAFLIEINPEPSSGMDYDLVIRQPAGTALPLLFPTGSGE